MKVRKEDALTYHTQGKPGKIEVSPYQSTQYATGFGFGLFTWCGRAL